MEKATSSNLGTYVDRRLHPVRLSIGHLNKLLEGSRSGSMLNVNRDLLLSITSTLEIFLEDFEMKNTGGGSAVEEKKSADKVTESPRLTQTRVG